jgi:hypothetical protein
MECPTYSYCLWVKPKVVLETAVQVFLHEYDDGTCFLLYQKLLKWKFIYISVVIGWQIYWVKAILIAYLTDSVILSGNSTAHPKHVLYFTFVVYPPGWYERTQQAGVGDNILDLCSEGAYSDFSAWISAILSLFLVFISSFKQMLG